jgi:hypothetical protein
MTLVTTPSTSQKSFQRRLYNIRHNFPATELRIKDLIHRTTAAEQEGSLRQDQRLLLDLKRTLALAKKTSKELQGSMSLNPTLKLTREARNMLIYVMVNAAVMLGRIEKLQNSAFTLNAQDQELERLDGLTNVKRSLLAQAKDSDNR